MNEQLLAILCSLTAIFGLLAGYFVGFQRGKNEGWLERYFAEVERDRKRRDARGRFTSVATK